MYRAQQSSVHDCFPNQNVTNKNSGTSTKVRNKKRQKTKVKATYYASSSHKALHLIDLLLCFFCKHQKKGEIIKTKLSFCSFIFNSLPTKIKFIRQSFIFQQRKYNQLPLPIPVTDNGGLLPRNKISLQSLSLELAEIIRKKGCLSGFYCFRKEKQHWTLLKW